MRKNGAMLQVVNLSDIPCKEISAYLKLTKTLHNYEKKPFGEIFIRK